MSRDAVFEEHKSWSWNQSEEDSNSQKEKFVVFGASTADPRGGEILGENSAQNSNAGTTLEESTNT